MNKKTVAVTGASGHIGNVVCRILTENGFRVKALYNSDLKSIEALPLERIKGSVLKQDELEKLIEGCELVIHCAAMISIHGDPHGIVLKTNTEGVKNVLEVSKRKGVRKIIHLSSVHAVTEHPLTSIFDESRPYKTASAYAYDYSKALGEQMMLAASREGNIEVVIVRPSSVIGPFDFKPSQLGKALLDLYRQKIPALPRGGYDFTDVRDVAQSIVNAIDHGQNGSVYLLTGKYHTLQELTQIIHKVTGKKTPGIMLPHWFLKGCLPFIAAYSKISGSPPLFTIESIDALRNGHPQMDHSKAKKELNHQIRPLEESVRDFYEWQRAEKIIIDGR